MKNEILFYQPATTSITLATNTFIGVKEILKFEDTNLIEVVKDFDLGYTTQIQIYHPDGTYLTKITGTRSYPTEEGRRAGVAIEKYHRLWVCKLGRRTLFEIHHHSPEEFRMMAELFSPEGYFIKCNDTSSDLIDISGTALKIGGLIMSGNKFVNCKTGIWLRRDGFCSIG